MEKKGKERRERSFKSEDQNRMRKRKLAVRKAEKPARDGEGVGPRFEL